MLGCVSEYLLCLDSWTRVVHGAHGGTRIELEIVTDSKGRPAVGVQIQLYIIADVSTFCVYTFIFFCLVLVN